MDSETINGWYQLGLALAAIATGFYFGLKPIIKHFNKKRKLKNEEVFQRINHMIWEALSDLKSKTKASRVSVIQFHNGGKFADGTSMRRMSISHQICDPKISSSMQFRQDVLVSRYVEIMQMLQDNDPKPIIVADMYDSNTKKFYEMHDTMCFSILPIFCNDSMLVYGYITLEWCDLDILDSLDENSLEKNFDNSRKQVSYLVNSTKDYR